MLNQETSEALLGRQGKARTSRCFTLSLILLALIVAWSIVTSND